MSNRPRRRRTPVRDPNRDHIASLLALAAERAYQAALQRHEAEIADAVEAFAAELRDPDHCEQLGLPRELPESAVAILAESQAISAIGPKRPRRDRYEV